MKSALYVRNDEPFEMNGEVFHRRACDECGGFGTFIVCSRHPDSNCPCAGREVRCEKCEDGELLDSLCGCLACASLAEEIEEALKDPSEVARVRRLADEAEVRWKMGGH